MICYTDGSVKEGQENGGAGCSIRKAGGNYTIKKAAGKLCSSFRAEAIALESAIEHISKSENIRKAVIFTDSKSAITKMKAGPAEQNDRPLDNCWKMLNEITERGAKVHIQWIPSHVGIDGNEEADQTANEAANKDQKDTTTDYQTAKAANERKLKANYKSSNKHKWKIGGKHEMGLTRAERTTLARIRTGHSTIFREYRKRIGLEEDGTCEECDLEEETRDHLLMKCLAVRRTRENTIGKSILEEKDKEEIKPAQILDFMRRIGRIPANDNA